MQLIFSLLIPNLAFAQVNQAIEFLQYYCGPTGSINYCLQGIYNLLVALSVFVAFVVFIFGAFKNLLSTVPDIKAEGKNQMKNAIIGLIVIFSSGVLLYWVNPEIFNAKLIMFRVEFTGPEVVITSENLESVEGTIVNIGNEFGNISLDIKGAIENTILATNYENFKELPSQINQMIYRAHLYANNQQGRNYYAGKYTKDWTGLTACNYFVFNVMKEAGVLPENLDICPLAKNFDEFVQNNQQVKEHAKRNNWQWQVIPFSIDSLKPGDIVVDDRPEKSHIAIVVPVVSKNGKIGLLLAHASLNEKPPRLTHAFGGFTKIVRAVPLK